MTDVNHTAVLGAGVIGASWTALFLASGRSVAVFDVSDTAEAQVRSYVEQAWPVLKDLGLTEKGNPDRVSFHKSAAAAVDGAQFIQESVPERLNIKHELFAAIEPALALDAVVASSASGLTLGEMQAGWKNPGRFVLGHPFNPPHLIPLVEVMGNGRTADGVAEADYVSGRRCWWDLSAAACFPSLAGRVPSTVEAVSRRLTTLCDLYDKNSQI